MNARFYAPAARTPGDVIPLDAHEAHHLTRVLRLGAGAPVLVFNGAGGQFEAVIDRASAREVTVRIGSPAPAAAEPRVAVTLAQAVLKGDAMDQAVRDAVMMGVAAIQPLVAARSEVSRATLERARRRERWQRIAVSSAKQCGRAVVPPVLESRTFEQCLAREEAGTLPDPVLLFVEPAAGADGRRLAALGAVPVPASATVMIGPEGGWTPEELQQAVPRAMAVTLGARTLRADAMPLAAIAALFAVWGEL